MDGNPDKPCRILELPNELLATVALHLDRSNDVRNLALVCKRLRDICQETLLNPVRLPRILPQHAIRKLLETLIDRPDLAKRVSHVNLGDYSRRCGSTEAEGDIETGFFPIKIWERYSSLFTEKYGQLLWEQIIQTRERDEWGHSRGFYLALLAAVTPNLQRLTFEMRPLAQPPQVIPVMPTNLLLSLQESGTPFSDPIMQVLGGRLHTITVRDNPLGKGPYMHNLSFRGLNKLTNLSLPIDALVSKNTNSADPSMVLPASLRRLQIQSCNKFVFEWLLRMSVSKDQLPALQDLDLFFKNDLRSALLLSGQGINGRLDILAMAIRALSISGLNVITHTRTNTKKEDEYTIEDMHAELDAWSYLTLEDVQIAAFKKVPFSALLARDEAGAPRRREKFEGQLLRAFWGMPLGLFTSPTFQPPAWSGVRMFNGPRYTGIDPKSKLIAPKHRDQKLKTEDKRPINTEVFKKKPLITDAARECITFDTVAWLEVDFFKVSTMKESVPAPQIVVESPRRRKTSSGGDAIEDVVALARAWKL